LQGDEDQEAELDGVLLEELLEEPLEELLDEPQDEK
jgi:hypothetical protein